MAFMAVFSLLKSQVAAAEMCVKALKMLKILEIMRLKGYMVGLLIVFVHIISRQSVLKSVEEGDGEEEYQYDSESCSHAREEKACEEVHVPVYCISTAHSEGATQKSQTRQEREVIACIYCNCCKKKPRQEQKMKLRAKSIERYASDDAGSMYATVHAAGEKNRIQDLSGSSTSFM